MTLSLAVSAATLLGGVAVTYCYDRRTPLTWRIPAGACIGLAAFGLIGFLLAMRFGLTTGVVIAASITTALPAAIVFSPRHRLLIVNDLAVAARAVRTELPRILGRHIGISVIYATGAMLLWRVAERAMIVQADGIYTGIIHNFGDLPFHLSITSRFVHGDNFPPEHPSFAGTGFTYPFLMDFLGAMFVVVGVPIRGVIVWSTLLLCLAFGALLSRWTLELTDSRAAALLAPLLAFFSGGLGWWRLVGEAMEREAGPWSLLSRLPHDYTITPDGQYRWGNLVTTLLVTQRGLLLGLPLAIIVFRLWWETLQADGGDAAEHRSRMIAAGVIAGMLPLVHAHSFAVVLGVAGCLVLLSTSRWMWLAFFAWSLALGLPQVWWITRASATQGEAFFAWHPGWDHGTQNIAWFWLKNAGLFIPLLVAALLWPWRPPLVSQRLRLFYLPFTLCFILPNLFRLAPWIWDNVKILVYWFIASVPLVALVLGRLMQAGRWRRALAAVFLVALILSGALDLWRVASGAVQYRVFTDSGTRFAALVTDRISPRALILHAPIHNHPVALSGRRSFMGHPGHVWSHGLAAGGRAADIRRMYAGGPDAPALLARYGIDYVVVGPDERSRMSTNESFLARYPLVIDAYGYRLYRVRDDRQP